MTKSGFNKFVKKHGIFSLILALFLAWIIYSYASKGIVFSLMKSDTSTVISFVHSFGFFAAVIFVLLVILEVVLAPIPPLALYIVAGLLFGGFLGGCLTLLGNLIGAFIDFIVARNFGRGLVETKVPEKLRHKFDKFFEKHGGLAIFILRINPLTTSDLVSYLSGLTKMKLRTFLVATGLGLIPMIFLQTYFGDFFIKSSPLLTGLIILFSVFYLVIFVYLIFIAVFKKKENKTP